MTFGHIRVNCPWVLNVENKTTPNEDRCTWRYNDVLSVLCNTTIHKVQQCNALNHKNNISDIQFVQEKVFATTINAATTQGKRKTFYEDLGGANYREQFYSNNTFLKASALKTGKFVWLARKL